MEQLPEKIVIIGAGVIGLEFATMFRSVGVQVVVIEGRDHILSNENPEISAALYKAMKRQGISFELPAIVKEIQQDDQGVTVHYEVDGNEKVIPCGNVLIAVGRKSRTDSFQNINLTMKDGFVSVNESMQTSIPNIYAAGDITPGPMLAHLAFIEGKVAVENALGITSKINYNAVPSCVYTSPEIATVGINEEKAIELGMPHKTGRFDFRNNGRALALGEREGFVKVLISEDHTIIGGQIVGASASELISELTLAITLSAKADILADMIHPHPALSEAIWEACADAIDRPIHQ